MFNFLRDWLNRRKCARVGHTWGRAYPWRQVAISEAGDRLVPAPSKALKRCKVCGIVIPVKRRVRKGPA